MIFALLAVGAAAHVPLHVEIAASKPPGIYPCIEKDRMLYGDYTGQWFVQCVDASKPFAEAVRARQLELSKIPSDQGCLGKDIVTCAATMGMQLRLTSSGSSATQFVLKPLTTDIYGKVQSRLMTFDVIPLQPVPAAPISMNIFAMDGEHVSSIDFILERAPLSAKTLDEWRETAVFELATAVLGGCVGPDRLNFYKLYDGAQRKVSTGHQFDDSYSNPGVSSSIIGSFKLCGALITASASSGINTETGSWAGSGMSISRPSAN